MPNLEIINYKTHTQKKENLLFSGFYPASWPQRKSKKTERYIASELRKLWNINETVIPIIFTVLRTLSKGLLRKSWKSEDEQRPSNYSIAEICQNTEKSPGDLLSLTLQTRIIS